MLNFEIDIKSIPQTFGIYLWKDINNQVIYIGKAKNIRKRIMQYINGSLNSYKTKYMIENSYSLDFIICSNEKESLLLEQEMIKKFQPPYNILLMDDKKYPFIMVTLRSNKLDIETRFSFKENKTTFSYGPLPTGFGSKLIKNFLIRECLFKNGLPIKNNDPLFWKEKFEYAKQILYSSKKEIIKKINQQMIDASNNEQYEVASEIRDTLIYLNKSIEIKQAIDFNNNETLDIIDFLVYDNYLLTSIHHFIDGVFSLQEEFINEIKISVNETIEQFINQFYKIRNQVKKIITNVFIDQNNVFVKSKIIIPKKGIYFQALENVHKNNLLNIEQKILVYNQNIDIYIELKKFLSQATKQTINDFIMIDNSHFQNENIVSTIIYYKKYRPYFSNYRKYFIDNNSLTRLSDLEYLKIGIKNYFSNPKNEVPNLIIVDGGKQHVNECKRTINKLNIFLPVIGLVKNKKHQTNCLINEKKEIFDFPSNEVYNFFSSIQIEVDRFAKRNFQNKSLQKSMEGFLLTINGIGEVTERKLLEHFKTYSNIINASEDELNKVVSNSIAKKIIEKIKKME